jgi:hypothetical protein
MFKFTQFTIATILFVAFIAGCSTDVELNAPYERSTVVFALLDPAEDAQWIRINRTWLGEGNQLDYALIADSSEYVAGALTAWVEGFSIDDEAFTMPLVSYEIRDTLLDNKADNGVFFAPQYRAYTFDSPGGLDASLQYRLSITFEDGSTPISAVTTLIASAIGNISNPPAGLPGFGLNWASTGGGSSSYQRINFKWSTTDGAKRYEVGLRIFYTERLWADAAHTEMVSETEHVLDWKLGTEFSEDDEGGEEIKLSVDGEQFYRFLASRLEHDPFVTRVLGRWDENIQKERAFDFVLTIGNSELDTYLAVNAPVTGVIQDRPEYTNIAGGIGLWASRTKQEVIGLGYSLSSIRELVEGDITANLYFCSPSPFSDYGCDN